MPSDPFDPRGERSSSVPSPPVPAELALLTAGLAHQLRNPLSVIGTCSFVLRDHVKGDPSAMRMLARIDAQVRHASSWIEQVLDVMQADRSLQPLRLEELTADLLERWPLPEGVELRSSLSASDPRVLAWPEALLHVLQNLVANACDAMGAGVLELGLSIEPMRVTVTLRDHGPGFPAQRLENLFAPGQTDRPEGHGVGLALSRLLVMRMNGTLNAANHPEGGAVVTLVLGAAPEQPVR